jgi:hypothetical protein
MINAPNANAGGKQSAVSHAVKTMATAPFASGPTCGSFGILFSFFT